MFMSVATMLKRKVLLCFTLQISELYRLQLFVLFIRNDKF